MWLHYRGRFVSAGKVRELGGEQYCGTQGIFLRDPSLKAFLKSPEAADALLRAIHGFAQDHSLTDCERIIEEYVDGKDKGLTRASMRAACGLPEKLPDSEDRCC